MLRTLLPTSLALLLSACGPATGNPDGDDGVVDRSTYPAGPYGTTRESVLEDLTFVQPSGEPLALSDIYADPENRLLLISTAAEWCTACREEQGALQERHEVYAAEGLAVLVAVFEDSNFQPANATIAGKWKEDYGLSFDVVADPEFQFADYYDESLTPMNMLVDVDTMEILYISTGWDPSIVDSLIEARL